MNKIDEARSEVAAYIFTNALIMVYIFTYPKLSFFY